MEYYIADGIIVAIFIVFCIVGLVKGFVKMVMRIFGRIGAFLIACACSDRLAVVFRGGYTVAFAHGVAHSGVCRCFRGAVFRRYDNCVDIKQDT